MSWKEIINTIVSSLDKGARNVVIFCLTITGSRLFYEILTSQEMYENTVFEEIIGWWDIFAVVSSVLLVVVLLFSLTDKMIMAVRKIRQKINVEISDSDLDFLKNALTVYDRIYLVYNNDSFSDYSLLGKIMNSKPFRESPMKILLLPAEKYTDIVSLYHSYEFSDRLKVVDRSHQHGELFNYFDNGLLTEEEVFELLLR